ncbi:putative cyclohexanonemonooxygenase [Diplodia seriata]|uniref:Putative cyclohexanonemonooxygenase n=1 Tax=Diplodia seriata TaxID=420778 RepID=A0A0G2H7D5_9PEZI|nr:putative cyclohexanonemonooxygenase [Diplodia seriata]
MAPPPPPPPTDLDALIVGGGFGGAWQLHRLQQQHQEEHPAIRLVERGGGFGGVWHANRYPGARVDSPVPHYEFSAPRDALWETWRQSGGWRERFPDAGQLRKYFEHVDEVFGLSRNARFGTEVTGATWEEGEGRWLHSAEWPEEGIELEGKRVAVVGTGATAVQLVQELGKTAKQLTVFQRTPNLALPMGQKRLDRDDEEVKNGGNSSDSGDNSNGSNSEVEVEEGEEPLRSKRAGYPSSLYASRTQSFPGFDYNFLPRLTFDDDAEQRRATYERLWAHGDFHFWLASYADMLADPRANAEAYAFWRDKTRPRIVDEALREKLAPMRQPHAFGCKRISLEDGYFETFNRENVRLVDLKETPIVEVTPRGIRTAAAPVPAAAGKDGGGEGGGDGGEGEEHAFDCIIFATGFDAITGGISQIDIRRRSADGATTALGQSLKEKWDRAGARTYLGLACAGFPNMFFTYGPQAPTAFCNGPTCAEMQGDWIVGLMRHMREKGLERVEAREESEEEWVRLVDELARKTLLPETKSTYYARLTECAAEGYAGFEFN